MNRVDGIAIGLADTLAVLETLELYYELCKSIRCEDNFDIQMKNHRLGITRVLIDKINVALGKKEEEFVLYE